LLPASIVAAAKRRAITPLSGYLPWKRRIDRVLAAVLLVPALPLMAVLMLLVRLTSRGPAIYRQTSRRRSCPRLHHL